MTHLKFSRKPFEATFNNWVDDLFSEMPVLFRNSNGEQPVKGFVPVNIAETEKSYKLEVIAPGFDKEDFKVNLEQDILTISAEKKNDTSNKENEKVTKREYNYRSFQRSFTLDEKIDAAAIDARYVNGVLTLNLPKKEEVKTASKQINIQ